MSQFEKEISECLLEMDLRPRRSNDNSIATAIGNFLGSIVGNKIAKGGVIKALNKLQEEIKKKYGFTTFNINDPHFNADLHRFAVEFINTVRNSDGEALTLHGIKTGKAFDSQSSPTPMVQIYPILAELINGYNAILNQFKDYPAATSDPDVKSLTQNIQYITQLKEVLDRELADKQKQKNKKGNTSKNSNTSFDNSDNSSNNSNNSSSQIQVAPSGQVVSQGYPQGQQTGGMKYAKGPRRLGNTSPPRLGNSSPPRLGY